MANRKLENKLLGGFVGFLLVIFGVQGLDTVNPDLFKGALAPNIYGNVQVAPKPIMMAHEYVEEIDVKCDSREEYTMTNCYYRIPLGYSILPGTRMEIDNELSDMCLQDQLNLVMCPGIYLKSSGQEKIFIRENNFRHNTGTKLSIREQRETSRKTYDFNDLYTYQTPGRNIYSMVPGNRTLESGNLRCQDYFHDVRKTNLRCGKVTVLREMGVFTGQKNTDLRIPENFRLPKANFKDNLKRAEFFVLADRLLNQSTYLRQQQNLGILEQFVDMDNPTIYLKDNIWWTGAAARLVERGVMQGYSDKTLRPYDLVSEAEFAKVVANIRGANIQNSTQGPWFGNLVDYWRARGTYIEPQRLIDRGTAVDIMYEALFL